MIARAYFYCCTVEAHIMYNENNEIKSSTNISASTVYQDTDGIHCMYLQAQWGCRDDHCPFSPHMISEALMRRKFSWHWKKTFWPYEGSKWLTIYPFGKLPTFGQLISVQIEKIKVNNIANIMRWKFGFVWTIHQVLFWILTNTAFVCIRAYSLWQFGTELHWPFFWHLEVNSSCEKYPTLHL